MRHARGAYVLRESMRVCPCNREERGRWPTDVPKISGDDAGGAGGSALSNQGRQPLRTWAPLAAAWPWQVGGTWARQACQQSGARRQMGAEGFSPAIPRG